MVVEDCSTREDETDVVVGAADVVEEVLVLEAALVVVDVVSGGTLELAESVDCGSVIGTVVDRVDEDGSTVVLAAGVVSALGKRR